MSLARTHALSNRLEVVEVDREHRHPLRRAPRPRQFARQPLLEEQAVGQPGQHVVVRQELDAPLRAAPLLYGRAIVADPARQVAQFVRPRRARHARPRILAAAQLSDALRDRDDRRDHAPPQPDHARQHRRQHCDRTDKNPFQMLGKLM
jgi:hypothetical protein